MHWFCLFAIDAFSLKVDLHSRFLISKNALMFYLFAIDHSVHSPLRWDYTVNFSYEKCTDFVFAIDAFSLKVGSHRRFLIWKNALMFCLFAIDLSAHSHLRYVYTVDFSIKKCTEFVFLQLMHSHLRWIYTDDFWYEKTHWCFVFLQWVSVCILA